MRRLLALFVWIVVVVAASGPTGAQSARVAHDGLVAGDPAVADDCARCHPFDHATSHPVGIRPSFPLPEGFPLDSRGQLTCATCHAIAGPAAGLGSRRLRRPSLGGGEFCRSCHADPDGASDGLAHSVMAGTAHGAGSVPAGGAGLPLDGQSLQCMGCHDGVISADGIGVVNASVADPASRGTSLGRTHPVGTDYAAAAGRNPELRPASALVGPVRLASGRVGCLSCHSPYSRLPNRLVVDNRGSALCLRCHLA